MPSVGRGGLAQRGWWRRLGASRSRSRAAALQPCSAISRSRLLLLLLLLLVLLVLVLVLVLALLLLLLLLLLQQLLLPIPRAPVVPEDAVSLPKVVALSWSGERRGPHRGRIASEVEPQGRTIIGRSIRTPMSPGGAAPLAGPVPGDGSRLRQFLPEAVPRSFDVIPRRSADRSDAAIVQAFQRARIRARFLCRCPSHMHTSRGSVEL